MRRTELLQQPMSPEQNLPPDLWVDDCRTIGPYILYPGAECVDSSFIITEASQNLALHTSLVLRVDLLLKCSPAALVEGQL